MTNPALEGGIMVVNNDNRQEINVLEFHRRSVVGVDGADCIGKETLVRILEQGGPRRRMLALAAEHEGERIEKGEWGLPVCEGDTPVGTSRSVRRSLR